MLFHSAAFVGEFLLPVLALFYLAARLGGARWALGVLVVASFLFYGWSHPAHVAVLLGSIVINYLLAGRLIALRGTAAGKRELALGIAFNVAVLSWFKYAIFFAGILRDVTGWAPALPALVLPLGISFFTFQKIAYLVDAWRGRVLTQRWPDYMLFVSFFPQLIAGPIVHHAEFFPQLSGREFARWRGDRIAAGAALFVLGWGKKVLLADNLAPHADAVFALFAAGKATGAVEAWGGVLAFSLQIYFDFSAYSDMAIGLALLFGITLPENFAAPYRAASLIDFWRRWHMTLSRFLRDHLYVPLGGNRHGWTRQIFALLVTMLLGGLWHGAAWTFVAWGAIHGAALVVNHAWQRVGWRMPSITGWALTFLVVTISWVFFRAGSFTAARHGLAAMAGAQGLWPGGLADGMAWLRAQAPATNHVEFSELFGFLDWLGPVGKSGVELRRLLLSDAASRVVCLTIGLAIVFFAPIAARWIWDLRTGVARFTLWKALAVGAVMFLVLLAGISTVPSTFIYFRF